MDIYRPSDYRERDGSPALLVIAAAVAVAVVALWFIA
jgi:hypothetical protein